MAVRSKVYLKVYEDGEMYLGIKRSVLRDGYGGVFLCDIAWQLFQRLTGQSRKPKQGTYVVEIYSADVQLHPLTSAQKGGRKSKG